MRLIGSVLLSLSLCGCCVHSAGIAAARSGFAVIKPEYVSYIRQDSGLTPEEKDTKIRTAQMLADLLEDLSK